MNNNFFIHNTEIGINQPAYIIAEVAQAHDGSLGFAHSFIDAASEAGADAVKFQTHIADAESTKNEKFRVNFSHQDASRYDYWKRMEFTPEQWSGLADHAKDRNIAFLSSPFSITAFNILNKIGMPAWKIASGEYGNKVLIDKIISTNQPILISSGMSSWFEIDSIVNLLNANNLNFCLMQCTSEYPTKFSRVGLNLLNEFRSRYNCITGLSDHSGSIYPSIFALAVGASIIEVHLTLSKHMFGPDVRSSVDFDQLKKIVEARNVFYELSSSPVDKDKMAADLSTMKDTFGRSLALTKNLEKYHILTKQDLTLKKPGGGIPYDMIHTIIGKRLLRSVKKNVLLKFEDLA